MRVVIEPGSELGAIVRLPSDGAKLPPSPVTTRQLNSEEQARYRPLTVADLVSAIREGRTEGEVARAHNRTIAQVRATLNRFGLPELSGKPRPGYSAPAARAKPAVMVTPEAVEALVEAHPEWRAEEFAAAFGHAPGAFSDVISALGISIKALRRAQAPPCTAEAVRQEVAAHPGWTEEQMARRFALQKAEFSGKLRRLGIDAANLWPAAPGRDLSRFVAPVMALPPEAPTDAELKKSALAAGLGIVRDYAETVSPAPLGESETEQTPEAVLERVVASGPEVYRDERRSVAVWLLAHPVASWAQIGAHISAADGRPLKALDSWFRSRFGRSVAAVRGELGLPALPLGARVGHATNRPRDRTEHYELKGVWPLPALAQRLTALVALLGDDAAGVTVEIKCEVHAAE